MGKTTFFVKIVGRSMEYRAEVMNEEALNRSLKRIAHEILEKNQGTKNLVLVGIKRRGIPLAQRIKKYILEIEDVDVPTEILDISFYRDDLSKIVDQPKVQGYTIETDLTGKKVVLIDDVLYTGRTARAAMDAILNNARPSLIQLGVVIDRGHRELPIRADYVGKNVPTSQAEHISVCVKEIDNENGVYLIKNS